MERGESDPPGENHSESIDACTVCVVWVGVH